MKTDLTVGGYTIHDGRLLLIHHRKLDKWLPVGGHIEPDETPDEALKREFLEETSMTIRLLGALDLPVTDSVKENLAVPFQVNVHNVGDHDHVCFFYLCEAVNPEILEINEELIDYRWFSKEELSDDLLTEEIRALSRLAFELYERREN